MLILLILFTQSHFLATEQDVYLNKILLRLKFQTIGKEGLYTKNNYSGCRLLYFFQKPLTPYPKSAACCSFCCASTTAMVIMFTISRTELPNCSMCTGFFIPSKIGPTASAPPTSCSNL